MTKKEREIIQKWELTLHAKLDEESEKYGLDCEYVNLLRSKWAGVYKLTQLLKVEVMR